MRYPHATLYAAEAVLVDGKRALGTNERHPLYIATLAPDVTLVGYDLTADEAKGSSDPRQPQGWFFVFQQNPSAPHFGLEPAPTPYASPAVSEWNQLSWANFADTSAALSALMFVPATAQPKNVAIVEQPNENPGDSQNAWGRDAAQTAFITLMRPARVGIHAEMMLP